MIDMSTPAPGHCPEEHRRHCNYLEQRAIPRGLAALADVHFVTERFKEQFAKKHGLLLKTEAVAIVYHGRDGRVLGTRARVLEPEEGKPKALATKGLAIPWVPWPMVADPNIWTNVTVPITIGESPFKALSLLATGRLAIGLGGVDAGFHDRDEWRSARHLTLHAHLRPITWRDRTVYIAYDAGIVWNPRVAMAAAKDARILMEEGAKVRIPILPANEDILSSSKDQGVDDYIAKNGADAYAAIEMAAVSGNPVERVRDALAWPAGQLLDLTTDEKTARAQVLLQELLFLAGLAVGGAPTMAFVSQALAERGVKIGARELAARVRDFEGRVRARAEGDKPEWAKALKTGVSGSPIGSIANALHVMANDDRIKTVLGYDELREEPTWVKPPPWSDEPEASWKVRGVLDEDATKLVEWLDLQHDMRITIPFAHAVIDSTAKEHPYHRVREFLAKVVHDGTERVAGRAGPGWLTTYLGVTDSAYVRAVGRKMLIGAVARIRQPGCKLDTMVVFEGAQGKLKSTAVEVLAGTDYYSDQLSDVTTKDASSDLRGKWCLEWSELDNLSRAENGSVKKYITRKIDDYRPAYGRRNVRVARQCFFVGTTNKDTYLKDETGNRRFHPVKCEGTIDIEGLRADRDQLWAEAVALYEAKERWWFSSDDGEALAEARDEQEARRVRDAWEELFERELAATDETTMEHVLGTILKMPADEWTTAAQTRVGTVLTSLGFTKTRPRRDGVRLYVYVRTDPDAIKRAEEIKAQKAVSLAADQEQRRLEEMQIEEVVSIQEPERPWTPLCGEFVNGEQVVTMRDLAGVEAVTRIKPSDPLHGAVFDGEFYFGRAYQFDQQLRVKLLRPA
jgi:predicted P-loop ATPase